MPDDIGNLDLHELLISGFIRINHAHFRFGDKPGVIQITGDNEQGKSSAISAILSMVGGARWTPEDCIREGYKEAIIQGDFGPLKVGLTVSYKPDGSLKRELTVTDADGGPYKNAATVINSFFNAIAFDPLSFNRASKEEKYKAVRGFVKGIDWEKENRGQEGDVSARRDARSRRDDYEAQAAGIVVPEGTPKVRVDESRLARELETAGSANLAREQLINKKNGLANLIDQNNANIRELRETIRKAEEAIAAATDASIKAAEEIELIVIPEPVDAAAIRAKLTAAQKTNQDVEALKRRLDIEALRDAEQAKFDAAQKSIDDRKLRIATAIEKSPMPAPGLSLSGGEVFYKGHPFENAATMVQLRVSIAIAMAQNPKLKLIVIREGGLLGQKAIALIDEMGRDEGYKVFIEKVDESGRIGFFMEDGFLAKVDGRPVKAEVSMPAPTKAARARKA